MVQKTFHNTTALTGVQLKEAVSKCLRQEQAVWLIYLHTRNPWTVSDILGMCERAGHNWIKVSIGRAVTNLFNKKELVKLSKKKTGIHGAAETYYQLNFNRYPTQNYTQENLFK